MIAGSARWSLLALRSYLNEESEFMKFEGEFGLQFTLHIANHYSVPELVRLADLARQEGFRQVWVNDNLGYRSVFTVLTAMASRVPVKLGTAILVPYFRNPVDVAGTLATLSELTEGREFSVGIARGAKAPAGQQVYMPKPIAMVRETTLFLQSLLRGETVAAKEYPVVAGYHQLREDAQYRLAFPPRSPIRFYSGGNGPKIHAIAGHIMDGVLVGGAFIPLMRLGRLAPLMDIAYNAASAADPGKRLKNVCEINVSISKDRARAKRFPKPYVVQIILEWGFTEDEYRSLGITPEKVRAVRAACGQGATIEEAAEMISDDEVGSCFVAGDAEECREQLVPLFEEATRLGFKQISLAKLGPDYEDAIRLLSRDIVGKLG